MGLPTTPSRWLGCKAEDYSSNGLYDIGTAQRLQTAPVCSSSLECRCSVSDSQVKRPKRLAPGLLTILNQAEPGHLDQLADPLYCRGAILSYFVFPQFSHFDRVPFHSTQGCNTGLYRLRPASSATSPTWRSGPGSETGSITGSRRARFGPFERERSPAAFPALHPCEKPQSRICTNSACYNPNPAPKPKWKRTQSSVSPPLKVFENVWLF